MFVGKTTVGKLYKLVEPHAIIDDGMCTLDINRDRVALKYNNIKNTIYLKTVINEYDFDDYCGDLIVRIGIDPRPIYTRICMLDKEDKIKFNVIENPPELVLKYKYSEYRFKASSVGLDNARHGHKTLNYNANIMFNGEELYDILRSLEGVGEYTTFEHDFKNLYIYSDNYDMKFKVEWPLNKLVKAVSGTNKSTYLTSDICMIRGTIQNIDKVYIKFSNNYPMYMKFKDDGVMFYYFITPKIITVRNVDGHEMIEKRDTNIGDF